MVEGFKNTDAGIIPIDWELTELNTISEKIMVGIASAATHAYRKRGIVLLRNQNIKNGHLDDSDILFISEDYERTFINKRLKEGDLITARTGYPGATCLIPKKYEGAQSFTTLITRPKTNRIISEYLNLFINSEQGQLFFTSNQIGGSQKNVNAGTLKKMPIVFPTTKAEQTAIATALNDADALIQKLEQLIAKKRNNKTGAMQELLKPKEGWEEKTIQELVNDKEGIKIGPFGSALKKELLVSSGYKVYGQENVFERSMEPGIRYITKEYFNKLKTCELKSGDFIVSMMGTIGKCMIVPQKFEAGIMDSHLIRLRLRKELIDVNYLLHYFSSSILQNQVNVFSVGGIMAGLSSRIIKQISISLPKEVEKQTHIAQILSDMDNEIQELEKQLEKYKMMKQGMMQSLLTGKIRLV